MSSQAVAAERVQLQKQISESQETFAKVLYQVIQAVSQKNQKDTEFTALKQKYAVLKNEGAQQILEVAGPRLWKYKDQIKNKNEQFLMVNSFDDEVVVTKPDELPDEDKINYIKKIIGMLKNTWRGFKEAEKGMIWQYLQQLLAAYAGYVHARRRIEELKNTAASAAK